MTCMNIDQFNSFPISGRLVVVIKYQVDGNIPISWGHDVVSDQQNDC